MAYATPTELEEWMGHAPPANAVVLLRSAGLLVDEATIAAQWHDTDTDVTEALRDATCAHAAFWAAHNINPLKGSADPVATTRTLGPASIGYANATDIAEAARLSFTRLVDEAHRILQLAGLTSEAPIA